MDKTALQSYLDFAETVADDAGKVFAEGFYGKKEVEQKNKCSWDLVTNYDKKVEELIISRIKSQYPNHRVLAEEETTGSNKKAELTDDPTWIIDPIDGTYNYVHGLPFTCISIALAINRQVLVGVVNNPLTHHKYTAIKGEGAYLNGKPLRVSDQQGLDEAIVSFELSLIRVPRMESRNTNRFLEITKRVNGVRSIGSAALTLCLVASGGIDAYFIEFIQPWDMAAGVLLIEEAGGCVRSMSGDTFDLLGRNILASSHVKVTEDILGIFQKFQ